VGGGKGGSSFRSHRRGMTDENGSSPPESQEPATSALRSALRALADIDAAHARFVELAGQEVADEWKDSLLDSIAALGFMPHRRGIPEVARFRQQVRQILHRRPGSRVAYRVLFIVQEDGPDGPRVNILALRHAAARPIARTEAREIEAEE